MNQDAPRTEAEIAALAPARLPNHRSTRYLGL
jgi:hypothetical protein